MTSRRDNARTLGLALGALFLFLGGPVQPCAKAQTRSATGAPLPPGQNPNGMHVYIWAGLKSHLLGQHDYPQFLADWSKVLTEHGAVVDGALACPQQC